MPRLARPGRLRFARPARHRAARRHLRRPVDVPHRRDPRRARHRRQRLVLPRARRRPAVAAAQRPGRRRQALGRGPPRPPRLHGRQHLLVVRDGRRHRHHRHPPPRLLRRRPQGTRLLHPAARPARRTHRRPRHRSPCSTSGARAPTWSPPSGSSTPTRHILRTRHHRPHPRLPAPPRLRPPALRPRRPPLPRRRGRARRRPGARCWTTRGPRAAPSWRCPSTASPACPAPWTSTGRCAAPGCWRCTPRTAWSTSTRGASRAFAVADHQLAHVYVRRAEDLGRHPGRPRRPARPRRTPRRRGQEGPRPGPPARRGTGRGGRAGRLVHVLLLAATTTARPTSPSWSRSTASPATTRPNSSSTPSTRT